MSRKYFIKYNEIIFFIKQKSRVQFKSSLTCWFLAKALNSYFILTRPINGTAMMLSAIFFIHCRLASANGQWA
jgi:hypothetical protein